MVRSPHLYTAKVMHRRLFPRENTFSYGVYYLALPLPAAPMPGFFTRFDPKDVGPRDGSDPDAWVRDILAQYDVLRVVSGIVLLTMPKVLGYVFNPVSFYLCLDDHDRLRAVLCEVHNTFGEQHSYLCANLDLRPIEAHQWLGADKAFHVSPFLERSGAYRFRFDLKEEALGIFIEYDDETGQTCLVTSLVGSFAPLTARTLRRAFWRCPLVTVKAIALIHWQAIKLVMKGVRMRAKPPQLGKRVGATLEETVKKEE